MPGRLVHPALDEHAGQPLASVELGDETKLAVVLQAAALAHLVELTGLRPLRPIEEIEADEAGRLSVGKLGSGRLRPSPQLWARRVLLRLLGDEEERIAGRGRARRAARELARRWWQPLVRESGLRLVPDCFEVAPFLWDPLHAEARRALVAHDRDGRPRLAVPGAIERRLLADDPLGLAAADRLAAADGRRWWRRGGRRSPASAVAAGRHREAIEEWSREPPRTDRERLLLARSLYATGRYGRALEVLRRATSGEALLVRLRSQIRLGRLAGAGRTIAQIERTKLEGELGVELAEAGVWLAGSRRSAEELRDWAARALRYARGRRGLEIRARAIAAGAAWDQADQEGLTRHLDAMLTAARDLPVDSDQDIENHQDRELTVVQQRALALRAMAHRDGPAMVAHLRQALAQRRSTPAELAARLWSELALAYDLSGDLRRAERALLHAIRLVQGADGAATLGLVFYNLAHARVRLGRLAGVEEVAERSARLNRRARNWRALERDLELLVRSDLAAGRVVGALQRIDAARRELRAACDHEAPILRLLEARAYGWAGDADRAQEALLSVSDALLGELEPEERPALWALAGEPGRARWQIEEGAVGAAWNLFLDGVSLPQDAWTAIAALGDYRFARLVWDFELVRPGSVPSRHVRRAIRILRAAGVKAFADQLESGSLDAWRAVRAFVRIARPTTDDVAALFAQAGYPGARLELLADGDRWVLVAGRGGAVELQQDGRAGRLYLICEAEDFVLETLFALVATRLRRPRIEQPGPPTDGLLGSDPRFLASLSTLDRFAVSRSELAILIRGESGTGKEGAARRIHRVSRRARGPFVAVNCAAITPTLLQSELFGHVRGAFTGADRDRKGVFEEADGGTVFLDEVGDLPLEAQVTLLRVLEESEVVRVGETWSRRFDARVVSATHRDLGAMVADGTFRGDLYYRLAVAVVELPPLRDRGNDVLLIASDLLARDGLDVTPAARSRLVRHSWPGNVRELGNVLAVAAALAEGGTVDEGDLPLPASAARAGTYHQEIEKLQRRLLSEALAAHGGNAAAAARSLGMSRQNFSHHLHRLEMV